MQACEASASDDQLRDMLNQSEGLEMHVDAHCVATLAPQQVLDDANCL